MSEYGDRLGKLPAALKGQTELVERLEQALIPGAFAILGKGIVQAPLMLQRACVVTADLGELFQLHAGTDEGSSPCKEHSLRDQ